MAIDAERALRRAADDVASKRGGILYAAFAAFALLSLPLHQTLTRELTEWVVSTADVPAEDFAAPATPFAVDLGVPVIAGGLVAVFLVAEGLRLVAVRSFASDAPDAVPTAEVFAGGAGTLAVLLAASLLVQVAVYGGIVLFVLPGLVAAVLTLFVRQAILLDGEGVLESIRSSASIAIDNAVQVVLLVVALLVASLLVGVPTLVIDPESFASPVVGTLLGTVTTVYGIAVITRAYQQLDDDPGDALGPDDLDDGPSP